LHLRHDQQLRQAASRPRGRSAGAQSPDGHPSFEYTAQFCHLYDQCAFDPDYGNMPLEAFEPMVHRMFSAVKNSIYNTPAPAAV
jgi:hypothetical protein